MKKIHINTLNNFSFSFTHSSTPMLISAFVQQHGIVMLPVEIGLSKPPLPLCPRGDNRYFNRVTQPRRGVHLIVKRHFTTFQVKQSSESTRWLFRNVPRASAAPSLRFITNQADLSLFLKEP